MPDSKRVRITSWRKFGGRESKVRNSEPMNPKSPNFGRNSVVLRYTFLIFKGRPRLDRNMIENFHLQRDAALKNSRIETH
jgi:hypothetical protein